MAHLLTFYLVFLDAIGNVKIGDFGLALARGEEGVNRPQFNVVDLSYEDMSLTSGKNLVRNPNDATPKSILLKILEPLSMSLQV